MTSTTIVEARNVNHPMHPCGFHLCKTSLRSLFWLWVLASACASGQEDVLLLTLGDGRSLRSLASHEDTTVILLYSPGDCLTCGSPVVDCFAWAAKGESREVALVLTKPPTTVERRQLVALRVRPVEILSMGNTNIQTPRIYILSGDTALDSAIGSSDVVRFTSIWNRSTHGLR